MKKLLLLLLLPIITFAQKEVVVHIKTDTYPSETSWVLYKDAYQGDTIGYVPFGYYTCIGGWGYEKREHNSSHIEVQEFGCYNLRGSTEHKMEKFFC